LLRVFTEKEGKKSKKSKKSKKALGVKIKKSSKIVQKYFFYFFFGGGGGGSASGCLKNATQIPKAGHRLSKKKFQKIFLNYFMLKLVRSQFGVGLRTLLLYRYCLF
jgi:hypothetical protein